MKNWVRWMALLTITGVVSIAQAQSVVRVTGSIIEENSNQPLAFASVVAKRPGSDQVINGTIANDTGGFVLPVKASRFYLEISFIGFETVRLDSLTPVKARLDLGRIKVKANAQTMDGVQVRAEKSAVTFKLDRRVFNVGQDLASTGVGALEVLNNVPSVNVDIEGNITLRGNSGVQILINGKPSVLSDEGSNALGTITADMIERVEVITNPSAKYEAEGSSGIINIVLKKEEKKGFNGSVSVNTGIPDNHSVGASLNRRTDKFNFFTQFGVGYRSLPRYNENTNTNLISGTSVVSEGVQYRNERFFNIRLGTDYHINKNNVITLSGSYAFEDESQPSQTDFVVLDSGDIISEYSREESTTAENPKYQYDLQYEKKFNNHKDHVLQFSTQGSFFGKEQRSQFSNIPTYGIDLSPNQRTETYFYQRDFIYKLDYVNPITKQITLESGGQYTINDVGNEFEVSNEQGDGDYEVDLNFTNNFVFNQKVLGGYVTTSYEGSRWGVKLGARVEHTDLDTELKTTEEQNDQNYLNLFPSGHASFKVSKKVSLQAGYSRRIYRPRLWDLNPFFNIRNNFNIRRGNPELQPEFGDSYEITSIFAFDKASFNASVYHLHTTNVIERVTLFEDNVNITQPENIGTRDRTGLEINGKYTPARWLTMNGDFNYGLFTRTGEFQGQNFDFTGDQWSTKLTTRFKLPAQFEVELQGNYRSPFVTVQGEVSGFAFANFGLRKYLWKRKASLNLSVRDVFASRIRESFVYQPTFESYSFSQRGRFITLNFSYSFGKGEAMTYTGRRR
jgi:outer membrane receptor protein involved in Fe transport